MNDFDNHLLQYEKRQDKDFTQELLKQQLQECLELFQNWDPHLYAELIDLIQISKIHLQHNLNSDQIDELTERRYENFLKKPDQDKK